MGIFNQIFNNPAVITTVASFCVGLLSYVAVLIKDSLEKSKNGKKILEAYKMIFGRLESELGQKIKQAKSCSEIVEIVKGSIKADKYTSPQLKK